jgi:hypothetical protein
VNGSIGKHLNLKGLVPDTLLDQQFVRWLSDRRRKTKLFHFGSTMPVLRYFIFVGGALLALMIGLSSFLPEPEAIARPDAVRPVIRIASDSVGPPRVDIDTRVQIAVVPATVPETLPQAPARVAQAQPSAQPSAPLPTRVLPARIERKKSGPIAKDWLPIPRGLPISRGFRLSPSGVSLSVQLGKFEVQASHGLPSCMMS